MHYSYNKFADLRYFYDGCKTSQIAQRLFANGARHVSYLTIRATSVTNHAADRVRSAR